MEELKPLAEITAPDIRSTIWVSVDKKTGEESRVTLKDHYNSVSNFKLKKSVPDNIRSHFATAKNLLLYTWYSYDFYPVAELHVLTTLEYALREKIGEKGLKALKKNKKGQGLHAYIGCAVEKCWIKNEDFSAYHRAPLLKAESEYAHKKFREMEDLKLDMIEIDSSEVKIPEANDTDFLGKLIKRTNKIRNNYAHGANTLHPFAWMTFEMCTEFINKLFSNQK